MPDAHVAHDDPKRLLKSKEAANLCALSVYTFNEKARQGLIRRTHAGDGKMGIRYRLADVLAYIDSRVED